MKVEIIKSSSPKSWYKHRREIFLVEPMIGFDKPPHDYFHVVNPPIEMLSKRVVGLCIRKEDCEIIIEKS